MSESNEPASETSRTKWTYHRRRSPLLTAFSLAGTDVIVHPFDTSDYVPKSYRRPWPEFVTPRRGNPEVPLLTCGIFQQIRFVRVLDVSPREQTAIERDG